MIVMPSSVTSGLEANQSELHHLPQHFPLKRLDTDDSDLNKGAVVKASKKDIFQSPPRRTSPVVSRNSSPKSGVKVDTTPPSTPLTAVQKKWRDDEIFSRSPRRSPSSILNDDATVPFSDSSVPAFPFHKESAPRMPSENRSSPSTGETGGCMFNFPLMAFFAQVSAGIFTESLLCCTADETDSVKGASRRVKYAKQRAFCSSEPFMFSSAKTVDGDTAFSSCEDNSVLDNPFSNRGWMSDRYYTHSNRTHHPVVRPDEAMKKEVPNDDKTTYVGHRKGSTNIVSPSTLSRREVNMRSPGHHLSLQAPPSPCGTATTAAMNSQNSFYDDPSIRDSSSSTVSSLSWVSNHGPIPHIKSLMDYDTDLDSVSDDEDDVDSDSGILLYRPITTYYTPPSVVEITIPTPRFQDEGIPFLSKALSSEESKPEKPVELLRRWSDLDLITTQDSYLGAAAVTPSTTRGFLQYRKMEYDDACLAEYQDEDDEASFSVVPSLRRALSDAGMK